MSLASREADELHTDVDTTPVTRPHLNLNRWSGSVGSGSGGLDIVLSSVLG